MTGCSLGALVRAATPPETRLPAPIRTLTIEALAEGIDRLAKADPRLGRIVARHGPPPMWGRPGGVRTLIRIVLEQQVSLRSAATLFARLDREVPGGLTVRGIISCGEGGLRERGVTRQKAAYLTALATAVGDGTLDLRALPRRGDEEARSALLAVRGIGPWSAAIYLLMALRRPDVWPPGDLALHAALARLRGLPRRPSTVEAERYATRWRPWRAIAARILWHGYLSERPERVAATPRSGTASAREGPAGRQPRYVGWRPAVSLDTMLRGRPHPPIGTTT